MYVGGVNNTNDYHNDSNINNNDIFLHNNDNDDNHDNKTKTIKPHFDK